MSKQYIKQYLKQHVYFLWPLNTACTIEHTSFFCVDCLCNASTACKTVQYFRVLTGTLKGIIVIWNIHPWAFCQISSFAVIYLLLWHLKWICITLHFSNEYYVVGMKHLLSTDILKPHNFKSQLIVLISFLFTSFPT